MFEILQCNFLKWIFEQYNNLSTDDFRKLSDYIKLILDEVIKVD